jgi:hypothetical protein
MQKLKPQMWTRDDGQQFVMVPLKDFNRLEELAEDRWLSQLLQESRERNKGKRGIPMEEVKRRLGLSKSRKVSTVK